MQDSVPFHFGLQTQSVRQGDVWVASCPALDVASQGDTEAASLRALEEAIAGWLESCLDRGVLVEALRECGFRDL